MMPAPLEFAVTGVPVPQGSMIARLKGGYPVVVASNAHALDSWRKSVSRVAAGMLQFRSGWSKETPVDVRLVFEVERGASVVRPRPSARRGGDTDKLARAILDALQNAGVYEDDAQVVDLHVHKFYSPTPGVRVIVRDASLDDITRR